MRSRQRILRAAADMILADGFTAVTITAVAAAAGVSRQTVYSSAGSREQLISDAVAELVLDMSAAIADTADVASRPGATAAEDIAAVVIAARRVLTARNISRALSVASTSNPVMEPGVMGRARPLAHHLLAAVLAKHPDLEDRRADVVDIAIVVGLHTVMFVDPQEDESDIAAFVVRWLGPALDG